MSPLRGAFLGFGHMAEHGHLPAWRDRPEVEFVAVADTHEERLAAAHGLLPDARFYETAEALLAAEELDFVDITTPPVLHVPLIMAAAARGCHVLCEKPLTTSAAAYRDAVKAVNDAEVTLFTVHNWKFSAPFFRVKSLLDEGVLGPLEEIRMESIRNRPSVTVGEGWRQRASVAGGGILVDHGWHALYLLPALLEEDPVRVRAVVEKRRDTTADVEDTATCRVDFPSTTSEIFLTWAGEERRTCWRFVGEKGRIDLEEDQLRLRIADEDRVETLPYSLSAGSHHSEWFGPVIDGFLDEMEGRLPRGTNLREAASCLTLLLRAYESAANGGNPLPVPECPSDALLQGML